MEVKFRKASLADLPEMLAIVAAGKAYLKQQGVDQWQMGDPSEAGLRADIAAGAAFVLDQNGRVMATLALLYTPDPSYAVLDGAWANDAPYASLHRMALHPDARGTSLGAQLMEAVAAECRGNGYTTIRVDTHADNLPMQKYLLKNGFARRGTLTLVQGAEAGRSRVAFDRVLD